jgi:thioesterase domain-containing protein
VAEQPIDLHIVPGSHVGILSEENVAEMATLLCRYLAGYNGHASEDTDQAS